MAQVSECVTRRRSVNYIQEQKNPSKRLGKIILIRIFRPILIVMAMISILIIAITSYDLIVGDGEIPEFSIVSSKDANETNTLHLWGQHAPHEDNAYWNALENSLVILDDINPQISGWIRRKHNTGDLIFVSQGTELAKYDYFSGKLTICHGFFIETEKKKVAMLAHEYRHSKQNYGKIARYILSCCLHRQGKMDIVENDAYLYEKEAEAAFVK